MNIDLNEAELQEYANQRMRQKIDQKVSERIKEIEWYKTVDHAVFDAVERKITQELVKSKLDEIDKQTLITAISRNIAEILVSKLYNE